MNYWMITLPPEDMEHCIKIGVFGRAIRGGMNKLKKGDKVVCYVSKECKIVAIGEATSDYYMDDKPIFKAEGDFPDRFNFKATYLKKQIPIRDIVEELSFITNKAYWTVYFRKGCFRIPEIDWKMIQGRSK